VLCATEGARIKQRSQTSCGGKGFAIASNETSIQIVNGDDAAECDWKWQVGLWSRWGSMPFCGGTLIDAEWVLTAAHCMGNSRFQVVAGDYKPRRTSGNEQRRDSAQVYKHPRYNDRTSSYDYALVRVSSPFTLNKCVGTACLPRDGDVPAGSSCWITGWGTLASGGSQAQTLQQAEVTVISNTDCYRDYGYSSNEIDSSMLCAQGRSGNTIRDACQGDSGGPLVCQTSSGTWGIYGATSWGYGCAGARYPGIWARVHKELSWIDSVMR